MNSFTAVTPSNPFPITLISCSSRNSLNNLTVSSSSSITITDFDISNHTVKSSALIFSIIDNYRMGGIDRMIASALSCEIKKDLDLEIPKKTERELFLEYGMSIKLSIEQFHKFTSVLRKNSSINVMRFEKYCIGKILKIKKEIINF